MRTPRIVLAIIGLASALALAEGVARWRGDRLCTDVPGVVYRADATTGWRRLGSLHGQMGPCERGVVPSVPAGTSPDGLLDEAPVQPKPAGLVRVLVLGGSAPEGLGVRAGQRFDRIVEQLADARRGRPLEVVNASVAGFALDNDLAFLRAEGATLAPDVVVVVVDPLTEVTSLSPALIAAAGQRVPAKPFLALGERGLVPGPPPGEPVATGGPPARAHGLAGYSALLRLLSGTPQRSEAPLGWRVVPPPPPATLKAERARAAALARALLAALQDATAALGARLVVVLAPSRPVLLGRALEFARPLVEAAAELGVPTLDLGPPFASAASVGRLVSFPASLHWTSEGHLIAGSVLWRFLVGEQLLPAGVVPARTLVSGAPLPTLRTLPAAARGALHDTLDGPIGTFVAWALLAVCILWIAAPLPPAARRWLALGLGVVSAVVVVGPRGAIIGVAGIVAYHSTTRLPRRPALAAQLLLIVALVAGTVPWAWRGSAIDMIRERLLLAIATNVLLLRLLALAAGWRRGRPPGPLPAVVRELVFFPTLLAGPLLRPGALARLERSSGPVPVIEGGALRIVLGFGLVILAVCEVAAGQWLHWVVLPLVYDPDGVTTARGAWGLVAALVVTAYLLFAGLTDLGTGLARMLGLPLARSFRWPCLAASPAEFWRRWLVSFQRWVHAHLYLPLGGGRTPFAFLAVSVAFLASALWYAWIRLKLVGPVGQPLGAMLGLVGWAAVAGLGVGLGRAWERRLGGGGLAARTAGALLTLPLVALAWAAFFLPGWYGVSELCGLYARLLGLG